MTITTTYREAIEQLDLLDKDHTLWVASRSNIGDTTPCVVGYESDDGARPEAAANMDYLLEVIIASEVLEVWARWRGVCNLSIEERMRIVAHYAEWDALPEPSDF
jgi:hypothetical protein